MTYPFLPTPQIDGEAQLLAINSALKPDNTSILNATNSVPLSDIFDFSEFAGENWSVAKSSSDTSGNNYLYSWTSGLGSVLTQVQSAKFTADGSEDELLPGYDQFDFVQTGSATFSTKNGDKLSIVKKNLSQHNGDDWHNISFSKQVNAKYVGSKDTTSDDVTYSCQANSHGWVADNDSQGQLTHTLNISGKTSGFSIRANGTWTTTWFPENSTETNTGTLKLGAYAYADIENSLSLSFAGTFSINLSVGAVDINLKKITAITADYKCTTAVLNLRDEKNFDFDVLPHNNYSQITTNFFNNFESIMMRGANIITITNRDGAYIDADKGADKITGSASNDVIKGGAGRDNITGGLGADLFVYGQETAGRIGINNIIIASRDLNRDTITDFKPGEDQIGIDAREIGWIDMYPDLTEILPSQYKIFAAGTTFTNSSASVVPLNQGTTIDKSNSYLMLVLGATFSTLYIDLDANGTTFNPVALATLTGVFTATSITSTDFVLVS